MRNPKLAGDKDLDNLLQEIGEEPKVLGFDDPLTHLKKKID